MVWRVFFSFGVLLATVVGLAATAHAQAVEGRLITVYDRGITRVFLSQEKTLGEALASQAIELDARDVVEPSLNEELIAKDYQVNIYRARPVTVVDGAIRIKTMSAHQTARQIAQDAGIIIYDEDIAKLSPSKDFIGDGAGLRLTVDRAAIVTIDLYGKQTEVRTQVKTVSDLLTEKDIIIGSSDRVSVPLDTAISQGLQFRIWREGQQTVSVDQEIPVITRIVYDLDRPLGYRAVQSPGVTGIRSISYQLEIKDGIEISKREIANVVTRNPTEQIDVIGLQNNGSGLTLSKGAQYFVDSKGVSHRETYYDLNMRVVMQSCGQGGQYFVRPDGAKVDTDGYIIIAANYGNYPKCSVVETSLGPGKVYDTGGFAARHPFGFDLATDWTKGDGI